ncbi:MAG: hypothetical protein QXJ14_02760 [Candidatus Aenigmatarchaeota archaeon]
MARKKEIIWAILIRKGEMPRGIEVPKWKSQYTTHPKWDMYILQEGEPEQWGIRAVDQGTYVLFARKFLNIGSVRKNASKGKNFRNNSKRDPINKKVQTYVKFIRRLSWNTTSKWSNVYPKKSEREKILKELGEYAFLEPKKLRYPIVTKNQEFSPYGLLAAYKRAKQQRKESVANLAKKIAKALKLSWAIDNTKSLRKN